MNKIKMIPFSLVLKDITSKFTKIKKQDYLNKGSYRIIDQGQNFIAGFTNDSNYVNNFEGEVIIFGDHTRVFKFINFPIAIGADGVKVLEVINKDEFDVKFLYYYLKSIKLHDAGYSRHFKFLKEIKIPLLPLENQQKIAQNLSQIEELINKRRESIKLLDELTKSIFLDMFGDPITNPKNEKKEKLKKFGRIVTGNTPPRATSKFYNNNFIEWVKTDNLVEDSLFATEAKEYLSEEGLRVGRKVKAGSLLVTCIAGSIKSIGTSCLVDKDVAFNQQINAIEPYENIDSYFLYQLFKIAKLYVQNQAGKNMKKMINKSTFENMLFPMPDEDLQKEFGIIFQNIYKLKITYKKSLEELNNLFGSIAQKAFIGEDVKKKIEKMKTYNSIEERLKSVEKEFISKMDKIMDNKSQTDLTIDDDRKAIALILGYKFGLYDDESIKLIDDFLDSEEFLIGDKDENELINKILEVHPQPNVFASIIKDDQSKNDKVSIIKNMVNKHSNKNILLNGLINIIYEKEQSLRVRYASSELIAGYDNLSKEIIKEIIEIIYNEEKIEEEVRLHTAYAFTDKINIYVELDEAIYQAIYQAIYWILRKQSTSLLSNKEVFIHFLEKEFEAKKESLAFDTLVKNIAYDSRQMTVYKMFLFQLLKYDINKEALDKYDYKALKDDIFRLIKEKKIVQILNTSTYEINLFWNFNKLEEE